MVRKEYFLAYFTCVFVTSISSENYLFIIFGHLKKISLFFIDFWRVFVYFHMCHTYCFPVYHLSFNVVYGSFYHMWCILSYVSTWVFSTAKSVNVFHYCFLFLSYMLSPSQITLCFLLVPFFLVFVFMFLPSHLQFISYLFW